MVIELDVAKINPAHKWIRVKFSADATAGTCIVIAAVQPRFKQKDIPTMVKLPNKMRRSAWAASTFKEGLKRC